MPAKARPTTNRPVKGNISAGAASPTTTKTMQKKADNPVMEKTPTTTSQTLLSYGVKPYTIIEGEKYMSDNQLAHFRKILNLWKNALLQGGDETIHDLKESAEIPADISDQATQEETFALRLRTRDRERKLIKKIEEAIELIDAKQYGYCEECGEEIGIRRLEARPTATLCIDCKTLDEVRERQRG